MVTAGVDAPPAILYGNQKTIDDNDSASFSIPPASSVSAPATENTNGHPNEPVATTSAVKVDDPLVSSVTSTTVTPDAVVKPEPSLVNQGSKTAEEQDEDAKLLASLASGLLDGNINMSEAVQSQLMATTDAFAAPRSHGNLTDMPGVVTSPATEGDTSGPIQAYAKLEFPGFSYYIQTLECTIGRRPAHMRTPLSNEGGSQHITSTTKMEGDVDVDLGLLKSISRLHVRILYQEHSRNSSTYPGMIDTFGHRAYGHEGGTNSSQGRFVLEVLGRNGCFVDDVPVGKDSIVPLGKRTKIQIAERVFYFVLPPTPSTQRYNSDGELDGDESLGDSDDKEDDSGTLGSSQSDSGSFGSLNSDEEGGADSEDDTRGTLNNPGTKRRPKLVLKKKVSKEQGDAKSREQGSATKAGKGKRKMGGVEKSEEEGAEGGDDRSKSARKAKSGASKDADTTSKRKRKRGEKDGEEASTALRVGTPIGVEALNLQTSKMRKKKKREAELDMEARDEVNVNSAMPQVPAGKGKGGGKAHIVAAAVAAKVKADEEKLQAANGPAAARKGQDTPASGPVRTALPSTAAIPSVRPVVSTSIRPIIPASTLAGPHFASRPGMSSASRPPMPPGVGVARPTPLPIPSTSYSTSMEGAGQSVSRPPTSGATAVRPLNGVSLPSNSAATAAPFPPSAAAFAHLASPSPASPAKLPTTPQPLPPAGPGIKPALNNLDLIRNALSNPISTNRGGKLTLQEIYEDISSKYEWYRNNNRSNGRDWHSAIRHAVGNSREMVRIPRKANEQGKGVFYALSTSEAAKVFRKEAEGAGNGYLLNQQMTPSASVTPPASIAPMSAQRPHSAAPPITGVPSSSAVSSTPSAPHLPVPATGSIAAAHPIRPPVARPSPPIQPAGRVSIVIGKAPAEALAQMAATPKAAITQNIEALFGGPPIVHHEGKLFLSPLVFGHMSPSEISDIGGKGAQQALAILQGHLVSHLQGKMKGNAAAKPGAGQPPQRPSPSPGPGPRSAAPVSAPPRPRPVVAGGATTQASSRPSSSNNLPARPAQPAFNRPPAGAPPQRPMASSSGRPSIGPTAGNATRPPPGGSAQHLQTARPAAYQGQAGQARPAGRPVGSGGPITTPSARPIATPSSRPVGPSSGPATRPQGSSMPASRPPPLPRPTPPSTQGSSVPSLARPAPAAASHTATARPPSTTAPPAAPAPGPPSSNAMMSAMQALASHPDAAGLMTLLSGGKVDAGTKLTPGQLDLLQQAGRIAAEQQKVQQQRAQEQAKTSSTGTRPASVAPSYPIAAQDTKNTSVQVSSDKQASPSSLASPSLMDAK